MLSVTFAFLVATVLFFCFRNTRWMGVLGVFVLLTINPVVFGALLIVALLIYFKSIRRRYYPLPTLIPREDAKKRG
jgi:hypothetical protein